MHLINRDLKIGMAEEQRTRKLELLYRNVLQGYIELFQRLF